MTTTPTESRLAITGEAHVEGTTVYLKKSRQSIVYTESPGRNWQEEEDFATLYADAHNTYNACGLTPSELLARLREAEAKIEKLNERWDSYQDHLSRPEP